MKTNGQACGNCRFYQVNPQDLRQGICRIRPPTVFAVPGVTPQGMQSINWISQWPPVRDEHWCGEWKSRHDNFTTEAEHYLGKGN